MTQRIVLETINDFQLGLFSGYVEREFRIQSIFAHNSTDNLAAVDRSNLTVSACSNSLDVIVQNNYGIVSRQLFSVPKLILFPGVLIQHPVMALSVIPISLGEYKHC